MRGDPADRAGKAALMARFCAEIGPLVNAGRFVTGPDMGTSEEDFAPLREGRAVPSAMRAVVGGVPFEDVLTGYGVAAAAEAALGAEWGWGWDGRSVAIEGFGKVGGGRGPRGHPPRRPGGRGVHGRRVRRGPVRAGRRAAARAAPGARRRVRDPVRPAGRAAGPAVQR